MNKRALTRLKKILKIIEPRREMQVDLLWVKTRPRMAKINQQTRHKNQATDVLSFPAPAFFQKQGILGELAICEPILRQQAREQKHSPEIELDVLLIHGVLHLQGFDHEESTAKAIKMAWQERKILKKLNSKGLRTMTLIDRAHSSAPSLAPRKKR